MTNAQTHEEETRVGYMATSILEDLCLDYIKASTINGKFMGDVHYLVQYDALKKYNQQINQIHSPPC